MEEMNLEVLNEIIGEVADFNCDEFSNLFEAIRDIKDNLEDFHQEEIVEYLVEKLNLESESDLVDLTDYEKENFINFVQKLY